MKREPMFVGEYGALNRDTDCYCGGNHTRYTVKLGDGGYECDPGIEHETRNEAMDNVATVIAELQQILAILAKEPAE